MIDIETILEFLNTDLPYQEGIVLLLRDGAIPYFPLNFGEVLKMVHTCTIKIQSMEKFNKEIYNYCESLKEKYNHRGPVTCHLFYAVSEHAPSFGIHTDPDDVIIHTVYGTKHMEVDGIEYNIPTGKEIYIPANVPHRALNRESSIMLSFGLEHFLIDKSKMK